MSEIKQDNNQSEIKQDNNQPSKYQELNDFELEVVCGGSISCVVAVDGDGTCASPFDGWFK